MTFKKIIKPLAIILSVLVLVLVFVVENVLPYAGIKPGRNKPEDLAWLFPKGLQAADYSLSAQSIRINTADSLSLDALLIASNTDTCLGTVVILHGITACKETNFGRAELLANAGYASLLLDLRAHGQSEGEFCTFGYFEKKDLQAVADTLEQRFPKRPIAIWGASLGGAVALQSMALDPRFQFGIIESTFDEFNKVALEYGSRWLFGIRSQWLTDRVVRKSAAIAHFEPDQVKPVLAASQIGRPVFFIHGDQDRRIPFSFGRRNFEACPSPSKRWYTVHGGGHNDLWKLAGDSLRIEVQQFLKMQG